MKILSINCLVCGKAKGYRSKNNHSACVKELQALNNNVKPAQRMTEAQKKSIIKHAIFIDTKEVS